MNFVTMGHNWIVGNSTTKEQHERKQEMSYYKVNGAIVSNSHAEEIYAVLKRRMNPKTHNVFARWRSVARELGLSESTVMRNVRHLIKTGRIRKEYLPAMNPQLPEERGFWVFTIL